VPPLADGRVARAARIPQASGVCRAGLERAAGHRVSPSCASCDDVQWSGFLHSLGIMSVTRRAWEWRDHARLSLTAGDNDHAVDILRRAYGARVLLLVPPGLPCDTDDRCDWISSAKISHLNLLGCGYGPKKRFRKRVNGRGSPCWQRASSGLGWLWWCKVHTAV
jgi:hypothetical protein